MKNSLPPVICRVCGLDLSSKAIWGLHPSGIYCVKCAPQGTKFFQDTSKKGGDDVQSPPPAQGKVMP